jgi:hypothetical protein
MSMNTMNADFGAHALDHAVGLVESAELFMSESTGAAKIQAGWSTLACLFCATGCEGTLSSVLPD